MIVRHIKLLLILTGLGTLPAALLFAFPQLLAPLLHVQLADAPGLFFARHWGLEVGCIGGLLLHAAWHAEVRRAVLLAAIAGKSGIVWLLLGEWTNPAFAGLHGIVVFDTTCVLIYLMYLLQSRSAPTSA